MNQIQKFGLLVTATLFSTAAFADVHHGPVGPGRPGFPPGPGMHHPFPQPAHPVPVPIVRPFPQPVHPIPVPVIHPFPQPVHPVPVPIVHPIPQPIHPVPVPIVRPIPGSRWYSGWRHWRPWQPGVTWNIGCGWGGWGRWRWNEWNRIENLENQSQQLDMAIQESMYLDYNIKYQANAFAHSVQEFKNCLMTPYSGMRDCIYDRDGMLGNWSALTDGIYNSGEMDGEVSYQISMTQQAIDELQYFYY